MKKEQGQTEWGLGEVLKGGVGVLPGPEWWTDGYQCVSGAEADRERGLFSPTFEEFKQYMHNVHPSGRTEAEDSGARV